MVPDIVMPWMCGRAFNSTPTADNLRYRRVGRDSSDALIAPASIAPRLSEGDLCSLRSVATGVSVCVMRQARPVGGAGSA